MRHRLARFPAAAQARFLPRRVGLRLELCQCQKPTYPLSFWAKPKKFRCRLQVKQLGIQNSEQAGGRSGFPGAELAGRDITAAKVL